MLARLRDRIDRAERRLRYSFGNDITDPVARRLSVLHYNLFDHALLRTFWTNFDEVAPGIYRSNQPTHARFRRYSEMGIRTVINLRGEDPRAHYLFEAESCARLGLTLIDTKLWARVAAPRAKVIAVIDALRSAERPLLFHCKSGADRAGFVAAMYMLVFESATLEEAQKQLSLRYLHLDFTKTGVQDYVLRVWGARQQLGEISFEEWIRTEYKASILQRGWDQRTPPLQAARECLDERGT